MDDHEADSILSRNPGLWEKLKPLAKEMRHKPTVSEERLSRVLRGGSLGGFKFRRQHGIEPFILDFYCADVGLIVEVDGSIHDLQADQERYRQDILEMCGFTVIRFRNEEVQANLGRVMTEIRTSAEELRSQHRRIVDQTKTLD